MGDPEEFAQLMSLMNSGLINKPTLRDRRLDELVSFMARAVNKQIYFARSVVQPAVDEYIALIEKYYRPTLDASDAFNIVGKSMPTILRKEDFIKSLSYYKDRKFVTPSKLLAFSESKTSEELMALFVSGASENDELFSDFFKENSDLVCSVYNDVFATAQIGKLLAYVNDSVTYDLYDSVERLLVTYLLADKYFETVAEVSENVSLAEYKKTLADLRDYVAERLLTYTNTLVGLEAAGTMVISMKSKTLTVSNTIYRNWLSQGNSQEALFGMMVKNHLYPTTSLVDFNKPALIKAWTDYINFSTNTIRMANFNNFLDALKLAYRELFNCYHNDLEATAMSVADYYTVSDGRFAQLLKDVRMTDLEDVRTLALRLIGQSRYYYSSAYEILSVLDNYLTKNPDLDPREAALLSTIEYVSRYMTRQMQVEKV
jgi:ribosome biogenesis protein Nip4